MKRFVFSLEMTVESMLLFRILPGKTTIIIPLVTEWPYDQHKVTLAIGVAGTDRHTGQSEQHEYSTAGEL